MTTMKILNWMQDKQTEWLYVHDPEHDPAGILSLWWSIRIWWRQRPMLIKCSYCQQKMWWNGEPPKEVYCCQECSFYGSYKKELEKDEIPF